MNGLELMSIQEMLDDELICGSLTLKAVKAVADKELITEDGVKVLMLTGDKEIIHLVELYVMHYVTQLQKQLVENKNPKH